MSLQPSPLETAGLEEPGEAGLLEMSVNDPEVSAAYQRIKAMLASQNFQTRVQKTLPR